MWEAIASNQRRSWVLISILGVIVVSMGVLVGLAIDPEVGAPIGALFALGLWALLLGTALVGGDQVLLVSVGARRIAKEDSPRLYNVVEEMAIASGFGRVPHVYIIDDDRPNAFAVGRRADQAAVAVTSGLLARLSRDELQGVVAHEMAHVVNRDVQFMTIAGVMVGSVVILAEILWRIALYSGLRGRRRSSGDPRLQAAIIGVALLAAVLAPLFAQILYFACSRRREYLADASAARFTRYPEGLASALEKIARYRGGRQRPNRALAPMYTVNPLQGRAAFSIFSTHPPTAERIKILRSMAGASYAEYESAFRNVSGTKERLIGLRTLSDAEKHLPVREPTREPDTPKDGIERAREVTNLLDRLSEFVVLTCACGVGIKVPSGYRRDTVPCPRCARENPVPAAAAVSVAAGAAAAAADAAAGERPGAPAEGSFTYQRQGQGWETFRCPCGKVIQLSPSFRLDSVRCRRCKRDIRVTAATAGSRR